MLDGRCSTPTLDSGARQAELDRRATRSWDQLMCKCSAAMVRSTSTYSVSLRILFGIGSCLGLQLGIGNWPKPELSVTGLETDTSRPYSVVIIG